MWGATRPPVGEEGWRGQAFEWRGWREENKGRGFGGKEGDREGGVVDWYGVLGVRRGAGREEVRAAYRRRAKELHPDVVGGGAEGVAEFLRVREAMEVLGDEGRRAEYDELLERRGAREERGRTVGGRRRIGESGLEEFVVQKMG